MTGGDDHSPIRELVLRWGWNATAFQVLEPGHRYFHSRGGVVAYADTGEAWVAVAYPDRFGGARSLLSTLRALAGGSLRGFAARTVKKRISGRAAGG